MELNIPFCNYDEGDCCGSTCRVSNGLTCVGPFPFCVDPGALENSPALAPTVRPTTLLTNQCTSNATCNPSFCGDGYCDESLNNAGCGWDGGDCCQESCVGRDIPCSTNALDYTCRDPTYKILPPNCKVEKPENVGDGFCDVYGGYNTAECDFDGGDCCKATCRVSKYQCPFEACAEGLGLPSACQVYVPSWIG